MITLELVDRETVQFLTLAPNFRSEQQIVVVVAVVVVIVIADPVAAVVVAAAVVVVVVVYSFIIKCKKLFLAFVCIALNNCLRMSTTESGIFQRWPAFEPL